ncbi:MAG: hypothetical protein K6G88_11735 [Lachnospiraceae bacterium]|nr:hypothetical protein [Lachnospiraceae bacterium]
MNKFINKVQKKIDFMKLKKQDLECLAKKGEYILSLCVNIEKDSISAPVEHHLPLKDSSGRDNDSNNWKLTDTEKETVISYTKDLFSYAELVVNSYDIHNDKLELLPLWFVFPTFALNTIQWRMGIAEKYESIYFDAIDQLSKEEWNLYKEKYPIPPYMVERYAFNVRHNFY